MPRYREAEDHTAGWFIRVRISVEAALPPFVEGQVEPDEISDTFEAFAWGGRQRETFFLDSEKPLGPSAEEAVFALVKELLVVALADQMLRHGLGP